MITSVRELARLAKVSKSTVSLALKNSPRLAPSTRERIQRLAREQGYRSDPVVVTLMNQLRVSRKVRDLEKLAYLTFDSRREPLDANGFAYFEGASQRATHLGYELEKFWGKEPDLTHSRLSKILHARGIRGVVIGPLSMPRGHISLDWQYFAAATMTDTITKPDLHRSVHYHYRSTILAIRRLKRHGYRRIGYVNLTAQDDLSDNAWLAACMANNYRRSHEPVPPLLLENWTKSAFREYLAQYRPDAIISNSLEPLEMLHDLRISVPDEVGYARLDLATENAPYSGIDQLPRQIGAAAVDLVVSQLQNGEFGLPSNPKTHMISGIWRDGPTTRTSPVEPPPTRSSRSSKKMAIKAAK